MSDINTRPNKIARRYGGVLFQLAQENKALKDVSQDLNRFRACIEAEPVAWMRVASSSLSLYTQRNVMETLINSLKLGKILHHFLMVLCQNRRLPEVSGILEEFLEQVKRAEGIMDGVLETPFELSDKEIKDLQKSLTAQIGQKIHLHQRINKNLLGGVVLRMGALMIDRSTRTQLDKLKTTMKG